jgi:SPP1 family phage portal protein
MIVRNRDLLAEGMPPPEMIRAVLQEFTGQRERMRNLREAYENKCAIEGRARVKDLPNNKLAHGYPRYIVTMAAGYLLGKPVTYTAPEGQEDALSLVIDAYQVSNADSLDAELAKDCGVYGKGVEICYADKNAQPKAANLNPECAFVVYDDTVECEPLFGVYFRQLYDLQGNPKEWAVDIYTDTMVVEYILPSLTTLPGAPVSILPHYFGRVPMIEYWNAEDEHGDFEQVQTLIDAYNLLQSDRVNDKEQFVDSLLVIWGARMEKDENGRTPGQQLRQDKILQLPDRDCGAEYLGHTMTEADVEVLKNALNADIHKFSMVPDLTDEHFAGNASGVAMRYKLLGLEQLIRVKERWFKEGLRERLRCFAAFLARKGAAALDPDRVNINMARGLPENLLEISQMVGNLHNLVPDEMLLSQVPFVENVQEALEKLKAQQEESTRRQMDAFRVPEPLEE